MLEAWEKETSNTISLEKNEKSEKYYKNEEQTRNTEVQLNEGEIGKLPEKEFRIMIVKMNQHLEKKMELQINSLETRIEKMQETFNKDL